MRYDKIEEFNVDSKAEFDQLNLAHETETNKKAVLPQGNRAMQLFFSVLTAICCFIFSPVPIKRYHVHFFDPP